MRTQSPHEFVSRDIVGMAELRGAAVAVLEADQESSVPEGPLGGQTVIKVCKPQNTLKTRITLPV